MFSIKSFLRYAIEENFPFSNVKKQETENIVKKAGSGKAETDKSESTTDYAGKLAKLVPSVEFKVGNTFSSAGTGKTLTVNPKLLVSLHQQQIFSLFLLSFPVAVPLFLLSFLPLFPWFSGRRG